jgi:hypothetical protein
MLKITDEMRKKLRMPLPPEAVKPHPTKTYLSTIKSIYVVERINDVFGVGAWTIKSMPVEILDEFIVVKAVLEIPEYGFYGEAYGGNDNTDRGDAWKGATTDALTKIAAQQLEIGMDVYKGLTDQPANRVGAKKEHWCEKHNTAFFKSAKMKNYAHPIGDTKEWCNEEITNPINSHQKPAMEKSADGDWDNIQRPVEPAAQPEPKPAKPQPDAPEFKNGVDLFNYYLKHGWTVTSLREKLNVTDPTYITDIKEAAETMRTAILKAKAK